MLLKTELNNDDDDDDDVIVLKPKKELMNKKKLRKIDNQTFSLNDNKRTFKNTKTNKLNNTLFIEGFNIGVTENDVKKIINDSSIIKISLSPSKTHKRQLCFIKCKTKIDAHSLMKRYQGYNFKRNSYLRITFSKS